MLNVGDPSPRPSIRGSRGDTTLNEMRRVTGVTGRWDMESERSNLLTTVDLEEEKRREREDERRKEKERYRRGRGRGMEEGEGEVENMGKGENMGEVMGE